MKFPKSSLRYYLNHTTTKSIKREDSPSDASNPPSEPNNQECDGEEELTPEQVAALFGSNSGPDSALGEDEEIRVRDVSERVLWLEDVVGEKATNNIIKRIRQYNCDDIDTPVDERLPIKICINSPGGDGQTMRILCNLIKISKTPVYTIVFGSAMSAASFILAAGHRRYAIAGSTILIHSSIKSEFGTREKIRSMHEYYEKFDYECDQELLACTNITPEDLEKKGAFDWYITAEEALALGIIDGIISDLDEIFN